MTPKRKSKEKGTPTKKSPTKVINKNTHDNFATLPQNESGKTVHDKDRIMRMLLEGTAPVISDGSFEKKPKNKSKGSPTKSNIPPPVPITPIKNGRKFYAGSILDDSPAPATLPKPSFLPQRVDEVSLTLSRSQPTFENDLLRKSPNLITPKNDPKALLDAIMSVGNKSSSEDLRSASTSKLDNNVTTEPQSLLSVIKEGKKPPTTSVITGNKPAPVVSKQHPTKESIPKILQKDKNNGNLQLPEIPSTNSKSETSSTIMSHPLDARKSPRLIVKEHPSPPPQSTKVTPKPSTPIQILRREQPRSESVQSSIKSNEKEEKPPKPEPTRVESLTDSFLRILRLKTPKTC